MSVSSNAKFQRTYEMTVQGQRSTHVFTVPTTLNLDVTRNITATPNSGTFTLFNIKQNVRDDIHLYRYDVRTPRKIVLRAGYLSQKVRPVIFKGSIHTAYSERRGVNVTTVIKAMDGREGMLTGHAEFSRREGWKLVRIVEDLIRTMPGIGIGTISEQEIQNKRGLSFNGNSWSHLQRLTLTNGGYVFIDKEVANFLTKDSVVPNAAGTLEINPEAGLINMPSVAGTTTLAQVIFEPSFEVGNLAKLTSKSNPAANGTWKINGFHHYGTISGVESGSVITDFNLISLKAPVI